MTTIFIVDDTPENIDVVLQHLNEFGYEVAVAESGASAIKRLNYMVPDLILLDVKMPGIDGFQVCGHIKSQPKTKDIPIIFMTALDDTANKIRGFEVGGADYITKPIEIVELLVRLRTHLKLRYQQIALKSFAHELTQSLEDCRTERDELYKQLHQKDSIEEEDLSSQSTFAVPQERMKQLSERETEVLQLIIAGNSSQEIAQKIHVSNSTVRTYRQRIMQKLQVNNLLELLKVVLDVE